MFIRVLQLRRFPSITLSAHSGVQALSILSLFSGFDGFSCVLLSLGIVHAGIFFLVQGRAYFISSHIMARNWSESAGFMSQEPDCAETHTYLHPYSLNSLHHSIYSVFIHQRSV